MKHTIHWKEDMTLSLNPARAITSHGPFALTSEKSNLAITAPYSQLAQVADLLHCWPSETNHELNGLSDTVTYRGVLSPTAISPSSSKVRQMQHLAHRHNGLTKLFGDWLLGEYGHASVPTYPSSYLVLAGWTLEH